MKNNLKQLREAYVSELERVTDEIDSKLVEGKESFTPDEVGLCVSALGHIMLAGQGDEDIDQAIRFIDNLEI